MTRFRASRFSVSAVVVFGAVLAIAGCGSGNPPEDAALSRTSIIKQPSFVKVGPGLQINPEVMRAFETFWGDMRQGEWTAAAAWYWPGLRRFINDHRLVAASQGYAPFFRTAKVKVIAASHVGSQGTLLTYQIAGWNSQPPRVIEWVSAPTGRFIIFDQLLNEELASWAQRNEQLLTAPGSSVPDRRAVAAGLAAAHLQADYLRQFDHPTPSPRPVTARAAKRP